VRLAWFSPLPPMASGIADYSSELLPLMRERAVVDVYCPRPRRFRRPQVPPGMRLIDPALYEGRSGDYDAVLYHLGNNPQHEFVYEAALRRPGITVFHDFVMHHLIAHMMVEDGRQPTRYAGLLRREYGNAGLRLADLRYQGVATEYEKFLFPLNRHVAEASKAIVVHSEDSADRMRQIAGGVPVRVIPHHAGRPPGGLEGLDRASARRALELPSDAFLVGHFGFITRPKQPAAVLGGFARLAAAHPRALLVMIGADNTGGGLDRHIRKLGLEGRVRMAGFVDLRRFYLYMKAVDAVVNLRFPSAGESSGTFARALAEGRPVIVNNLGSFSEVPPDVALKVEIDGDQAKEVGDHLLRLADDLEYREAIERRARAYAATVLDPSRCRDLYLDVARLVSRDSASGPAPPSGRQDRPPIAGGADVRDPALAMPVHRESLPGIDALTARTLPPSGAAVELDLLYRLLLRRPAEEPALRSAQLALAAGEETRAGLVRRIVGSREFREIELIEQTLARLRREGGVFSLRPGDTLGPDTTERVVEVPWVLSRWRGEPRVLDAGYAFASDTYLTALLALPIQCLHGVDAAARPVRGMLRSRGDLRALPYREEAFDLVLCVSTIEHVGRDNTAYGLGGPPRAQGDLAAVREIERTLARGGRALVTVPFGRAEVRPEFVQYDPPGWDALVSATRLVVEERQAYRLTGRGWELCEDVEEMAMLRYGDDGAPAARGVLCAALRKPG
jgi:glycosyltransferase involved in cell wall biosynthesis/SAM-dependent methyltransferase